MAQHGDKVRTVGWRDVAGEGGGGEGRRGGGEGRGTEQCNIHGN